MASKSDHHPLVPARTATALSRFLRRDVLRIGGQGFLGLSLPTLWQAADARSTASAAETVPLPRAVHRPAKAKSVVFLYQFGGPSHVDTFDMKPEAPDGIRSQFQTIDTALPGVRICEQLPETARVLDKVTLVRSVFHRMRNHNSAAYIALTGHTPPVDDIRLKDSVDLFPAYGSVVSRLGEPAKAVPSFAAYPYVIRDGSITPGQHASFLGKTHDPFLVLEDPNAEAFQLPELKLPAHLDSARLNNRRAMQALINAQAKELEASRVAQGMDAFYERSLAMLTTPAVRNAFDLASEPEALRRKYGRTTYGQSCLLARRLVEAGVKFVNVYFAPNIGGQSVTDGGWDTHGFNDTRMYPILKARHLPLTDHTLPVFLNDLDERGLLDSTLVVWMGEFGRTVRLNANISRDHWPQCYTVLLAGGGVKRGYVHGASDRYGEFPAREPAPLEDIAATMFHLLGIDPATEIRDKLNRPFPISPGRPITGVLA